MGNVVRAETCRGVDGYALGPEYRRRNLTPLLCITVGGLDQGFSDIEASALDNSVGLGVVRRDTDVVDTIAVSEDLHGIRHRGGVGQIRQIGQMSRSRNIRQRIQLGVLRWAAGRNL